MVNNVSNPIFQARNIGIVSQGENKLFHFSPSTGARIVEIPISGRKEIQEAFEVAHKASLDLSSMSQIERSKLLNNFVESLRKRKNEIVEAVSLETGKSIILSEKEFETSCQFMSALAGMANFQSGTVIPSINPSKIAFIERSPFGISALITSYNTPLPNYAWKFAPSFLAGNISILKPSEFTAISATIFAETFYEVSEACNALILIHGNAETGGLLVESPVDLISFTGSVNTGKTIQLLGNRFIRKNILELGGNNPFIVFEDANLSKAKDAIIQSAFSNGGQRCAAGSRLLIHKKISKDFISELCKKLSNWKFDETTDLELTPLISADALNNSSNYIEECRRNGADVHVLGEWDNRAINGMLPHLISNLKFDHQLMKTEVFAPILRITEFESEAEAIDIANDSNMGLTCAIWTENISRATQIQRKLNFGVVNVNGPTHGSEYQFPFGGTKESGNGTKEVGISCINEYSQHKLVTILGTND